MTENCPATAAEQLVAAHPVDEPAASPSRRLRRPLVGLAAGLGAAGAVALTLAYRYDDLSTAPGVLAVLAIFALFLVAEGTGIHVRVRQQTHSVSISELPMVLGLFLLPPHWLLALRLTAAVLVFAHRRTPVDKVAFNLGLFTAEVGVATLLLRALGAGDGLSAPDWLIAYATMLVVGVLGALAVTGAITLIQGAQSRSELAWTLVPVMAAGVFNTTLALLALLTLSFEQAWPLLGILVLLLVALYRVYNRLVRQHADLGKLVAFTQSIGAVHAVDERTDALLSAARDLLQAEHAVLVPARESVHHPASSAHDPQPMFVTSNPRDPVERRLLARLGWDDAVLVPLRLGAAPEDPASVLMVGNTLGTMRTFSSGDMQLLQTLAAHAELTWRNARLLDQARHDAEHDSLTGLANRALLLGTLQQVLDRYAPGGQDGPAAPTAAAPGAAVLLLDLDRFKDVNDSLGHHIGDLLLQQVARRLEHQLGSRALVARLGGDEFAVLVDPCGSAEQACALATETRALLSGPFEVAGTSLEVGVSVGVALLPEDGKEPAVVLQHADIAMYEAKRSVGVVRYVRADEHASRRRLVLAGELRRAIDEGQITLHYQPQLSLADGTITGYEALARWEHPVRGMLTPDEFIPIAEQTGLITALTHDVLSQALRRCRDWQVQQPGARVAVNLSTRDLRDPNVTQVLSGLLAATGLDPALLTLEITESSVIGDFATALTVLQQLRGLGVHLSLDDFGVGYSSLTYLQRLPVDEVKIDKSFVTPMLDSPAAQAITRSVVGLGHSLGLTVVAEGVETDAARTALQTMGCDTMQGYLLSRPLAAGQLTEWLAGPRQRPGVPEPGHRRGLRAM